VIGNKYPGSRPTRLRIDDLLRGPGQLVSSKKEHPHLQLTQAVSTTSHQISHRKPHTSTSSLSPEPHTRTRGIRRVCASSTHTLYFLNGHQQHHSPHNGNKPSFLHTPPHPHPLLAMRQRISLLCMDGAQSPRLPDRQLRIHRPTGATLCGGDGRALHAG
jgi:hypothetical protein